MLFVLLLQTKNNTISFGKNLTHSHTLRRKPHESVVALEGGVTWGHALIKFQIQLKIFLKFVIKMHFNELFFVIV